MFLLIDNYDSFTYNLVQAFAALGKEPLVLYNDDPRILEIAEDPSLEMVCLSPGPSSPQNAGLCLEFLAKLSPKVPCLGVCLGHQILGLFGGAKIGLAPTIMHGKQSEIRHTGDGLFLGLPEKMVVGRYHSLIVEEPPKDALFSVTARGPMHEIMALRYWERPWVGVQFHPESILSQEGMQVLANFPQALFEKEDPKKKTARLLETIAEGKDLERSEARLCFEKLMNGELSTAQTASLLMGLRMKGATSIEVAEASRAVLEKAKKIPPIEEAHIDVVGTGGDGKHSFNCSTATSLVLAGMGYLVTKHGNRAVSSTCGSADAIEGLGLPLEEDAEGVMRHLSERRFAFLYAPNFHPAFKHVGPVRQEMGIRTLFNLLGPLLNPARPTHLFMGVGDPLLVNLVCETLLDLNQPNAAVVCGAGVYDEVTPLGPSRIFRIRDQKMTSFVLDPRDYGIQPCGVQDLEVHSKHEAVTVLRELVKGKGPSPMLDMIVLNVGVALNLLEDWDLARCMGRAREAVLDGAGERIVNA